MDHPGKGRTLGKAAPFAEAILEGLSAEGIYRQHSQEPGPQVLPWRGIWAGHPSVYHSHCLGSWDFICMQWEASEGGEWGEWHDSTCMNNMAAVWRLGASSQRLLSKREMTEAGTRVEGVEMEGSREFQDVWKKERKELAREGLHEWEEGTTKNVPWSPGGVTAALS